MVETVKKTAKVAVIGHFGAGLDGTDGQTIKTRVVTAALDKQFGENDVLRIDTHGSKLAGLVKAPFQVVKALKKARNVIIFPAQNGIRIFVPLLTFFKKFFKGRRLHYSVIGGWLPEFLKDKPGLEKKLKKFDGIYVETNTMKNALEARGFANIFVVPNCKELAVLKKDELVYPSGEPYALCTFSRVMQQKGIEDAVNAVKAVNEKYGRIVYTLDIYGQVDAGQVEWFENLKANFPDSVRYRGLVEFSGSVEVLKNYFALLFPTLFYTEGIPGTIIDAYAAGIPVISAKWQSFPDVVDDGATGIGYEFGKFEDLVSILSDIAENPEKLNDLKENCIKKAEQFLPETALEVLFEKMA